MSYYITRDELVAITEKAFWGEDATLAVEAVKNPEVTRVAALTDVHVTDSGECYCPAVLAAGGNVEKARAELDVYGRTEFDSSIRGLFEIAYNEMPEGITLEVVDESA